MSAIPTAGLRHVALRVRDLARARAFYVEVFGMRPVWEPDPDNCYLTSGCDNLALHVNHDLPPQPGPAEALDHIGFVVDSRAAVWAAAATLRARGVPIVKQPRDHRDGSSSVYCSDPDGNVVQVLYEPAISGLRIQS